MENLKPTHIAATELWSKWVGLNAQFSFIYTYLYNEN